MSRLVVEAVGPATSVQDEGRFGAQRYGLGAAGAMDRLSLAEAQALIGGGHGLPAIEVGPFGAAFRAEGAPVRLALTGAKRTIERSGVAIAPYETFLLADGETVRLGAARDGVFSYLAIEGGLDTTPMMGSYAVHARAGLGRPYPRPLQSADVLPVHAADPHRPEQRLDPAPRGTGPIRVVLGPQDDHFTAAAIDTLTASDWAVSPTSDRMGYRLEGPPLEHAKGHNIVSDGIAYGSIQVPGSGLPLVLLADRGTTGGYPKIATVITADLGRLAQTPAGAKLRFARIDVAAAQIEARRMAAVIAGLSSRIARAGALLDSEALLAANLAGAAVDARSGLDEVI